jgi:hypothetical protein
MIEINETKLNEVVETALGKVKGDSRWTNAILRGEKLLTGNNPYLHFDGERLLVLSESGQIYTANGTCQCKAHKEKMPCKHRAAFGLLKRYFEVGE